MGCTKIECQANRIRSGHYKEQAEQWKKSSTTKDEQLAKANARVTELEEALEWARPIMNELCELYMDELWGEINKDTEYELMRMKNFTNPIDIALTHPGGK